jgi:hypothetical protein
MAESDIKWRVKESPQMSADLFAQYMTVGDKKRVELARSARYQPKIPAGYHAPVRHAVKKFLVSKTRDWTIIADAIASLAKKATDPQLHPKMRERLLTNINALTSFQNGFNALGIGGFKLEELDPQQPKLKIGDLPVSVSLDFLIHSTDTKQQRRVGGILFSFSKRSEPKKVQTIARYERLTRHAAAMIHMHLTDHFPEVGKALPKNCLWIDNHLQGGHSASADYKTLIGDMEVAANRIVKDWPEIDPPSGFDPKYAKYVK